MVQLTDFAVEADEAKDLSGTALGVAEETRRTNVAIAAAVLERLGNGSGGKESGDGEELHFEEDGGCGDNSKNGVGSDVLVGKLTGGVQAGSGSADEGQDGKRFREARDGIFIFLELYIAH
ncbi:hypothetical protein MKX07_008121 [Trichoderma sp. CBMAI-0711]|nr:hypothetical protein MKX07_008121 [Trichoderma sp. CBMAI-0711]